MNTIFSKALGEYYSHRETCGMKDSPKECIDKFYSRSKKEFPGEKCLTQEMIDAWWTKRPTESSNTHAVRVCQVLPFLRFVAERYPESHYIIRKVHQEFGVMGLYVQSLFTVNAFFPPFRLRVFFSSYSLQI